MPKSKVRKKGDSPVRMQSSSASTTTTRSGGGVSGAAHGLTPSPSWYPVVMSAVLIIGLAYIVVWYFAPDNPVMSGLGGWNLAVGFGVMIVGLIMAVRWR